MGELFEGIYKIKPKNTYRVKEILPAQKVGANKPGLQEVRAKHRPDSESGSFDQILRKVAKSLQQKSQKEGEIEEVKK